MRWTAREIALLDKMDDTSVSEVTGRSIGAVKSMRLRIKNMSIPDDDLVPLAVLLSEKQKLERLYRLMIEFKVRLMGVSE